LSAGRSIDVNFTCVAVTAAGLLRGFPRNSSFDTPSEWFLIIHGSRDKVNANQGLRDTDGPQAGRGGPGDPALSAHERCGRGITDHTDDESCKEPDNNQLCAGPEDPGPATAQAVSFSSERIVSKYTSPSTRRTTIVSPSVIDSASIAVAIPFSIDFRTRRFNGRAP